MMIWRGAVEKLRGNFEVSVTRLPWLSNMRVRDFHSHEELLEAVLASSCAVPFAGLPMHVPGKGWLVDGFLSDTQIVKVSPGLTYGDLT